MAWAVIVHIENPYLYFRTLFWWILQLSLVSMDWYPDALPVSSVCNIWVSASLRLMFAIYEFLLMCSFGTLFFLIGFFKPGPKLDNWVRVSIFLCRKVGPMGISDFMSITQVVCHLEFRGHYTDLNLLTQSLKQIKEKKYYAAVSMQRDVGGCWNTKQEKDSE